jgi:hypothetical protein
MSRKDCNDKAVIALDHIRIVRNSQGLLQLQVADCISYVWDIQADSARKLFTRACHRMAPIQGLFWDFDRTVFFAVRDGEVALQFLIASRPIDQEKERKALLETKWHGLLGDLERRAAHIPPDICLRVYEIGSSSGSQGAEVEPQVEEEKAEAWEESEEVEEEESEKEESEEEEKEESEAGEEEEGQSDQEPADWEEKVTAAVQVRLAERFRENMDSLIRKRRIPFNEQDFETASAAIDWDSQYKRLKPIPPEENK